MLTATTDVLIVGAGPTGMALSIALTQAGVDHLIVDKLAEGQNTSRAAVIHAQTLESLSGLGVTPRLVQLGLKLDRFAIRDRDRPLLMLSFDRLPSNHPYLLMLPQHVTEKVLADRIAELGGILHRGIAVTGVSQDAGRAQVSVVESGRTKTVSARYVVGADGMHSLVRGAAGIEFEGSAHNGYFVLADVHMDWPLERNEVSLFFSPEGLAVVAPLPDGSFRIVATVDDAPETPTIADVQALLDSRGPASDAAKVLDIGWSSRFRVHHRIARSYRYGRLLLIGDAAHVHSPAGGQGMNTGLIDAVVLGQLLADVVKGVRPDSALDLYETLRRPAAMQVLALAGRLTGMATMRGAPRRIVRNGVLAMVNLNPFAKRRIAMNLSGLGRANLARVPEADSKAQAA